MPRPTDASGAARADFLEQIELSIRVLASADASEIIGRALRDLPGLATVTVRAVEQLVRVTYDPAVTSAEAIRSRMDTAGLLHPERDADAHGPEGER